MKIVIAVEVKISVTEQTKKFSFIEHTKTLTSVSYSEP